MEELYCNLFQQSAVPCVCYLICTVIKEFHSNKRKTPLSISSYITDDSFIIIIPNIEIAGDKSASRHTKSPVFLLL